MHMVRRRRNGLLSVPASWVDAVMAVLPELELASPHASRTVILPLGMSGYSPRWTRGLARLKSLDLVGADYGYPVFVEKDHDPGAVGSFVASSAHVSERRGEYARPTLRIRPGRAYTATRSTVRHELQHFIQWVFDFVREAEALPWPKKGHPGARELAEMRMRVLSRVAEAWGRFEDQNGLEPRYTPATSAFPLAGAGPKRTRAVHAQLASARPKRTAPGARDTGSSAAESHGRAHSDYDTEVQTDLTDAIRAALGDALPRIGEPGTVPPWLLAHVLTRKVSSSPHVKRWAATHPARYRWALGVAYAEISRAVERRMAEVDPRPLSLRLRLKEYQRQAPARAAAKAEAQRIEAQRRADAERRGEAQRQREEIARQQRAAARTASQQQRKAAYAASVERFRKKKR